MGDNAGIPRLEPLDPRVRVAWWIAGCLDLVAALALSAPAAFLAPNTLARLAPLLVLAIGTPAVIVIPWLRYRRWRYALREQDLWIRQGVIWIRTSVIPYARLQFVDTTRGPLDRVFGLAQLVVHTAAPGTSGRLPGLDVQTAESLRERLSRTGAPSANV